MFLIMLMFVMLVVGINEADPIEETKKRVVKYPRQVVSQQEADYHNIDLLE